ncbi:lactadherin-like [Patiria miniata]|uniref:F5/8 type C domain-containing protein n=1 Tax=Patiria miniata TaxID=46514 RepID=A0A914AAG6_PATMI|nr:lactadherin-like [Patiria miniata]
MNAMFTVALITLWAVTHDNFGYVEAEARVCYFGNPIQPGTDNQNWMKAVFEEIRQRCPKGEKHTKNAQCSGIYPLGIEDGSIPDERLTASSSPDYRPATHARLNNPDSYWRPDSDGPDNWIEVDLTGTEAVVSGIITQGSNYEPVKDAYYMSQYKVAYQTYSPPSDGYQYVKDSNGATQIFEGNSNAATPVENRFDSGVLVAKLRIVPVTWRGHACLRFELLGCRLK